MKKRSHLTLKDALRLGRVDEFSEQEAKRGIQPISISQFNKAVGDMVKPLQSKGQTLRSPSRDGSDEK